MAASPKKRHGSGQIPEVVIYTDRKSCFKRSNSFKSPSKEKQKEVVDDEFVGLSRIEQIRLRARRKAEEEDRVKQEEDHNPKRRKSYLDDGDSDDDDDDLPDLDNRKLLNATPKISSSLSSAPSHSQQSTRNSGGTYYAPSSSLTPAESPSPSKSPEIDNSSPPTSSMQRSRRKAARLEPYIFRPSLDPLSERRRKLLESKESAAVQAKLVKREDFRRSAGEGRGDAIEKILREQRKERRKGLDSAGLDATIKLVQDVERRLAEVKEREEEEIKKSSSGQETDIESDDESSKSSDSDEILPNLSGDKRVKFKALQLQEDEEREKRKLSILLGDESVDEETAHGAFNILLKDRDERKRNKMGELEDVGLEGRRFWKEGKVRLSNIPFPSLTTSNRVYDMMKDSFVSQKWDLLALILESGEVDKQLLNSKENVDVERVIVWLLEIVTLRETSRLSIASLRVIQDILSGRKEVNLLTALVNHLPQVLLKLGAKDEVLESCFGVRQTKSFQESTKGKSGGNKEESQFGSGEKLRVMERVLQVIEMLAKSMKEGKQTREHRLSLLLVTLQLSVDPSHDSLGLYFDRTLQMLFDIAMMDDLVVDEVLLQKLSKLLASKTPTTKRAVIDNIPANNFRTRALQSRLAFDLVFSPSSSNETSFSDRYNILANALSSKDAHINPMLAMEGRDFKQLDANLQLICYCFNDLALQLAIPRLYGDSHQSSNVILKEMVQSYLDIDEKEEEDDNYLFDLVQKSENGKEREIDSKEIQHLYRIMESLQIQGNRIQDGKGAFLDKSKVKDQLQRIRLMLLYQLGSFGLSGSKTSTNLHQGTLAQWFQPSEA